MAVREPPGLKTIMADAKRTRKTNEAERLKELQWMAPQGELRGHDAKITWPVLKNLGQTCYINSVLQCLLQDSWIPLWNLPVGCGRRSLWCRSWWAARSSR